jgi:RNA polymerase sigma-70 factor (ECF subfamily)
LTRLALEAARGTAEPAEFIRAAQGEVWRFCAALTKAQSADDLTQETLIRALRALPRFRGNSSARTWLLVIARRVVADHVRAQTRRRRLVERLRATAVESLAADPHAFVTPERLLGVLDSDRRDAFVLTQLIGLSYAEAAAVLGCPIGTIRSRVARAREDLVRLTAQAEAI